jgi:hypothetical protein
MISMRQASPRFRGLGSLMATLWRKFTAYFSAKTEKLPLFELGRRVALVRRKIKSPVGTGLKYIKSGRHDWTRTNDPHHVKVVL